jgi:class 3 adenylate cyclase/tetratricopeptide (TPR) repeat protein
LVCPHCSTDNEAGRKFCRECGQRLSIACPTCGRTNSPDDKFCGECGTALTAGAAPTETPSEVMSTADTERRLVSVLFADLVGSTSFAEGRDPEDVRAMLGRYFDAASEAVERHGGMVEKFIGDAVMAVWGTPVAHEDDAERAVRSALDIVDRVAALGVELGITLQARVGVLTGEAVASVGAVGQGLVAGDLVNTASRLQSAAEPGTVLVGERTYRSAAEAIAFGAVEPLTLKGKQEKVPAWQALRVVSEVGGALRGSAPEPPFVGRDEELRLTKELLHATGRESRPRLLSVTGVAGIGKSRLLWELRKYIDGITELIYWHQGRCPAYGEGVTFWAFAEMVRGRAGIAETDDEATARQLLTTCLADLVPDLEERRWMEPRLGHLLGLDPSPAGGRDELFGAWRRFVERIADRGTTVLAFEDLHWADPGLLDFVESLLTWSRTSPILVVSLARPELSERRPTWGAAIRSTSGLHLEPLPDPDMRALVTGYVDGLPDADLQRLVERAEGIPLYAVETVRMLADRGFLQQDDATYRVVSDLVATLDVPETLHALVAARLDGLPDAERSVVLDASVTGHSFTLAAVSAVAGRPVEEIEPRLQALVRKEVFDQEVDPRSAERGQYHFVQSVIQEVAYSTLSKAARRSKHLACARWFAALGEGELAGIVASHFLDAYRAEPSAADAEEIAGQAREWLRLAAERAFTLGSPETAIGYAEQGLTLATTPAERAALHGTAATGAGLVGKFDLAWEHYAAASDAYRILGDVYAEAALLAEARSDRFEGEARLGMIERLEDIDRRLTDQSAAKVLVLSALADHASSDGRHEEALVRSEQAMVLAQTLHDDQALMSAARAYRWSLFNTNRHFEAGCISEGLVELTRRSGALFPQLAAVMGHGVNRATSEPRRAMALFLDAAALAERGGMRPAQMMGLANASETAIDLGELDVAARALDEADEISAAGGLGNDGVVLSRAMLLAYRGDPAAATQLLDQLEASRRPDWVAVQMTTWYLRTRGMVQLIVGDAVGSLALARESIGLEGSGGNAASSLWQGVQAAARLRDARAISDMFEATTGLLGEWVDLVRLTGDAVVATLTGEVTQAAVTFASALDLWRDRDFPVDHALAAATAAHVLPADLVPRDEVDTARAALESRGAVGLLRLFPHESIS